MKKILVILILLFPIVFFSCAEKTINVLILGNSITNHVPDESIGWNGNWGMAATSAEKDFKNIFTQKMIEKYGQDKVNVFAENIAVWEKNFKINMDQFSNINKKEFDIVIIRLGENVDVTSPDFSSYESELSTLVNHYKSKNTKVIITGTVWSSSLKDAIQEKVAKDNGYKYIPLLDFQADPKNYATGKFKNEGVAAHPSDYGMNNIAVILFKQVEKFLD